MYSPFLSPECKTGNRNWQENGGDQQNSKKDSRHENHIHIWCPIPVGFAHLGLNPSKIYVVDEKCDDKESHRDAWPWSVARGQNNEANEDNPPQSVT
jgi:hypothetical protein